MRGLRHMKAMMMGVSLVVLTNAIVLAGVAYNRSGDPDSSITLTERELRLPYRYSRNDENSGIHLRLNYRRYGYFDSRYEDIEIFDWFNKDKLANLGFDVSHPFALDEDKRHYQWLKEKEVILVLEYNGKVYQDVLAKAKKHLEDVRAKDLPDQGESYGGRTLGRAENTLLRERKSASRLFVIDAGLDRDVLREKYTGPSYILLKGLVGVQISDNDSGTPSPVGYIKSLSNPLIHVSLRHHDVLEKIMEEDDSSDQYSPPHYEATIHIGQRLEPWLVDVVRLNVE